MNITSIKTKSISMCGDHIQREKIVINDNPIEQVRDCKYLGHLIMDYKRDLEEGRLQ
jgi:hypothetical protein